MITGAKTTLEIGAILLCQLENRWPNARLQYALELLQSCTKPQNELKMKYHQLIIMNVYIADVRFCLTFLDSKSQLTSSYDVVPGLWSTCHPNTDSIHKLIGWLTTRYWEVSRLGDIDGLVQERRNSSALAMELRLSWTNPSILV